MKKNGTRELQKVIRDVLTEQDLTASEVGRRMGLKHSGWLAQVMRGDIVHPTFHHMARLADTLGVSLDFLAGREQPPGFGDSAFWKLYRSYSRITKPIHRKLVEDHIKDLIRLIDALPKG